MKDASVTSLLCAIHTFSAHSLEYCSSENVAGHVSQVRQVRAGDELDDREGVWVVERLRRVGIGTVSDHTH